MADIPDWEAKYWANKQREKLERGPSPTQQHSPQRPSPSDFRDVDTSALLQQRMMSGITQGAAGQSSVLLREGVTYYRQIQGGEGFGSTMPLVRSMGPVNGVGGKEFVVMGEVRGYCIDNLSNVDLSKVNDQPDRMLRLVKVRAPFVGDILVEQSAVVYTSPAKQQQTLLKG